MLAETIFFSKLLRNVLIIERKASPSTKKKHSNITYEDFEGKIIRNVDITVLDVFGSSINNIKKNENSWLEKAANRVHKNTYEWVIRRRLLFKYGDELDPLKILETA